MTEPVELWTIGHSSHALADLVTLLRGQSIELLVDVRTVPKSKRHPQFWSDALAVSLPAEGIAYEHLPQLGGWRRASPDSPNGAWRNASFRGYADYTLTDEFAAGMQELCMRTRDRHVAIMCSEALWWRCHRRLIADRVVAGGGQVWHISSQGAVTPHELADFGRVDPRGRVIYPATDGSGTPSP
jgi:uncharacterized protein (DUF488 family)